MAGGTKALEARDSLPSIDLQIDPLLIRGPTTTRVVQFNPGLKAYGVHMGVQNIHLNIHKRGKMPFTIHDARK